MPLLSNRAVRWGLLGLGSLACLATSRPRIERNYPAWELTAPSAVRSTDCADVEVWISKSGKEGVGVSLDVLGKGEAYDPDAGAGPAPCQVALVGARFQVDGQWIDPPKLPEPAEVAPGGAKRWFVAFPFDNEAKWNAGKRDGVLQLGLSVRGEVQPDWFLEAKHLHRGYHREVRR